MSGFIQNLLARHFEPIQGVRPRLRGLFEPPANALGVSAFDEQRVVSPDWQDFPSEEAVPPLTNRLRQSDRESNKEPTPEGFHSNLQPTPIIENQEVDFEKSTLPNDSEKDLYKIRPVLKSEKIENPKRLATNHFEKSTLPNDSEKDLYKIRPVLKSEKIENPEILATNQLKKQAGTTTQTDALNGRLPHVPSSIQPALGKVENLATSSEGLSHLNVDLQEMLPEAFRRSIRMENRHSQPSAPVVKINIGRIEVKALKQQVPASQTPKTRTGIKPKLTLEGYLKKQNGTTQ
ncbi:MAG: hypothetical protein IPM82_12125 [Saprospiraceae bacterium]|nr:hypothetical protein [Saprospiraceae bacterium]